MEPSTYFVSDLHLFSRRSQAVAHEGAIRRAAVRARNFVLGGDIFDFRWSTLGSPETTVRAAVDWVDALVSKSPDCQFHFVAGNHDYNQRFLSAIGDYAQQAPNLQFHHYYLRLAGSIFLHGDAADHPTMCATRLQANRQHWLRDESRGPVKHMLYDLAVKARLHRLAGVIHPKRKVAQRLLGYLDRIGQGPGTGLEHVYFGHTHQAMANYSLGGLTFHNGGAPMAGLQFRIVDVPNVEKVASAGCELKCEQACLAPSPRPHHPAPSPSPPINHFLLTTRVTPRASNECKLLRPRCAQRPSLALYQFGGIQTKLSLGSQRVRGMAGDPLSRVSA